MDEQLDFLEIYLEEQMFLMDSFLVTSGHIQLLT
jgi:hypothetical protein